MSPHLRNARGVTLIEIMVAIAIVGILAAGALATLQPGIERRREVSAVREMWAESMRARQEAVSRNQATRLIVEQQPVDGVLRWVMRWERPPCEDGWSATCPSAACEDQTCRSGCECDAMGTEIVLPDTVDARPLHGVCFQAGTGRPFRGAGIDCQLPAGAQPASIVEDVTIDKQRREDGTLVPFRMVFDGITGVPSLVDCAQAEPPAVCGA